MMKRYSHLFMWFGTQSREANNGEGTSPPTSSSVINPPDPTEPQDRGKTSATNMDDTPVPNQAIRPQDLDVQDAERV